MDRKELEIIQQLMEELQGQMEDGPEDFDERLGRKKPDVEIMKIEGKVDPNLMRDQEDEEMMGEEEEPSVEMFGDEDDMEEMSPEHDLMARIKKLRG